MENTKIEKVENVEATEEKKPEGFMSKVGGFFKRNGKKIAAVVAVGAGVLGAYVLGRNSALAESDGCYDGDPVDESEEYSEVE